MSFNIYYRLFLLPKLNMGFPVGSDGEESACNAGDPGSIPESERYPGVGNENPFQHSCLENHGQRSLVGYSPVGRKESDTTQPLTHTRKSNISSTWQKSFITRISVCLCIENCIQYTVSIPEIFDGKIERRRKGRNETIQEFRRKQYYCLNWLFLLTDTTLILFYHQNWNLTI